MASDGPETTKAASPTSCGLIYMLFLSGRLFRVTDCSIGAGRDAEAVKVALGMVDDSLAVNQVQRAMGTHLDTFPGTTAFFMIDDNFHGQGLARFEYG